MARLVLRVGYWNVYGAYGLDSRDGFGKCPAQGALIEGQKCDLVVTLENHEETYRMKNGGREKAYMPLQRCLPSFDISEGDGGNQLLVRKGFGEVIRKSSIRLAPKAKDARSASKWNIEAEDVRLWAGACHFPAGQTTLRRATRAIQVPAFLAFMRNVQRGFIAYDSNDFKKPGTPGTPQSLMTAAGWIDMREKSLSPTVRGHQSSNAHSKPDAGVWIENIRTRKGTRVLASGMVPVSEKLSDHNFMWADLEIDSEILLAKNDRRA